MRPPSQKEYMIYLSIWLISLGLLITAVISATGAFVLPIFNGDLLILTILFLAALTIGGYGHLMLIRYEKNQPLRDDLAKLIAEGKNRGFGLYLRPFSVTGRIPLVIRDEDYETGPYLNPKTRHDYEDIDLEIELVRALRAAGPLVALGRPGEAAGAGRVVTSDQEWKVLFRDLVDRAQCVFLVPGRSEGTKWELQQLLKNPELVGKTCLLIPPTARSFGKLPVPDDYSREALAALEDHGIKIPADPKDGLLVRINPDGQLTTIPLMKYKRKLKGKVARLRLRDELQNFLPDVLSKLSKQASNERGSLEGRQPERNDARGSLFRRLGRAVVRMLKRDMEMWLKVRIILVALGAVSLLVAQFILLESPLSNSISLGACGLIMISLSPLFGIGCIGSFTVLSSVQSPGVKMVLTIVCALSFMALGFYAFIAVGTLALIVLLWATGLKGRLSSQRTNSNNDQGAKL
jgi:hypothetical protein